MARKATLVPGLLLILLIFVLAGCSPTETPTEAPTPTLTLTPTQTPLPTLTPTATQTPVPTDTPDSSIVWSDDFEDGDSEGWEVEDELGDAFAVKEGIVSFFEYGYIAHPSSVSSGTWSTDVFIPDADEGFILINFMCKGTMGDESSEWRNMGIAIEQQSSTTLWLGYWDGTKANNIKTETISESQRLIGWHHVDITRDESGVVKAYINKELVLESGSEYPHEPNYFHYLSCCEGPGLDNVVVRNQVMEIQPVE